MEELGVSKESIVLDMVKRKFEELGFIVETDYNTYRLHSKEGTTIVFGVEGPMGAYLTVSASVVVSATASIND